MIVTRSFTVTVPVDDTQDYAADSQRALLALIAAAYAGRCWQGVFVLEVLRVLKKSSCRISDTDFSGGGSVDATFEASVAVLSPGDILVGVEITSNAGTAGVYGVSSAEGNVFAQVQADGGGAALLRPRQTVCLRLTLPYYSPMSTHVAAAGRLLTCEKDPPPVYALEGGLSAADGGALAPLVEKAERLLRERAALTPPQAQRLAFFEGLLHPARQRAGGRIEVETAAGFPAWAGEDHPPLPPGTAPENLLVIAAEAAAGGGKRELAGLWCRDPALHRSSPLIARSRAGGAGWPGGRLAVAATPLEAFAVMLQGQCEALKAGTFLARTFESEEAFEDHRNVWAAMAEAQWA